MTARVEEGRGAHEWAFDDHRVAELAVEREGMRLRSWSMTDSLEVRLLSPFSYAQADGSDRAIDPRESEQAAPMLSLVGRLLLGATVREDGALELRFGDGSRVACAPHARREAWELTGAGAMEGVAYRAPAGGGAPW